MLSPAQALPCAPNIADLPVTFLAFEGRPLFAGLLGVGDGDGTEIGVELYFLVALKLAALVSLPLANAANVAALAILLGALLLFMQ